MNCLNTIYMEINLRTLIQKATRSATGFEFGIWAGLMARARAMDTIVARLNNAFNEWFESPANVALAAAQVLRIPDPMTPQLVQSFFRAESDKFIGIAKTFNLVAQGRTSV